MCFKVSENIFWVIFVSKWFDAGNVSKIDFEKCFMVNRTNQPEGCIGISEKCVFSWESLSTRYREQLQWVFFSNCSFTSTLLELNKLAFERMLREELSVKVVLKSSL